MKKICTTIEQSQKLIELGIDRNTADMCWQNNIFPIGFNDEDAVPAWSLSALLKLMPKGISIKADEFSGYRYNLEWAFANDNSLRYVSDNKKCLIDIYSDHDDEWKGYIDIAFEMICWLLENKKT